MSDNGTMRHAVDFDLHGLVAVRLLNAREDDVRAVARQLGPIRVPPDAQPARSPQIVVRFVEREQLEAMGHAHIISLGQTAYIRDGDERHFFVLRGKHKTPARVRIPVDKIGDQCEIVCQHGISAVPYLIPILNLTVLANGALPLHAGAFVYNDLGVLVTGWSKGGKTEALLGFMARGASYVADEWTYLFEDGHCMAGIPEPLRVWEWHLREAPVYRQRLTSRQRLRLTTLGLADRVLQRLAPDNGRGPLAQLHRVRAVVAKQQGANVTPSRLFGEDHWTPQTALDRIFFVESSEAPQVTVQEVAAEIVARRMLYSLQEEQRHLLALYRQFRFAFPEAPNTFIEQSQQIQAERLQRMLAGKESYIVRHPYPVPIEEMVTRMEEKLS